MKYRDKIVLVTGGGSGVGRATALAFARAGAEVVVSGRNPETLGHTVKQVETHGGRAVAITADVTRSTDVGQLVDDVIQRFGQLDIAVNNAGVLAVGTVTELPEQEWHRVLDVNTTGVFLAMKHQIPVMRAAGGGVIVNIGSNIGAHMRLPGFGAYAASKAAVGVLSRTAALEYIRDGVRINVVSPGPVEAPMSLLPGETDADRAARFQDQQPIGRIATVDEVTSAVLWVASDEASYVVGHDLVIDGAATA
ncbi:SDR family NAD(P)-dependent oxidoreductase [Phytoactinopolyspora mesophila]|uniref:Glucose 1-dehydrogenase n=1 Tax=Phytoactinopolyspora mesophila TaxID=2650750 RepID=A0A7K3M981_9ACTN|nr:glucose 1-dehydrogenase [Phytoactinopolyspora mesophila]NDL59901.1 glucose 1-dehydrogenase [Phytoactinopolyspora mesophila]